MLISIDHGNKLIKTLNHEPFTSGLQESEIRPISVPREQSLSSIFPTGGKSLLNLEPTPMRSSSTTWAATRSPTPHL